MQYITKKTDSTSVEALIDAYLNDGYIVENIITYGDLIYVTFGK